MSTKVLYYLARISIEFWTGVEMWQIGEQETTFFTLQITVRSLRSFCLIPVIQRLGFKRKLDLFMYSTVLSDAFTFGMCVFCFSRRVETQTVLRCSFFVHDCLFSFAFTQPHPSSSLSLVAPIRAFIHFCLFDCTGSERRKKKILLWTTEKRKQKKRGWTLQPVREINVCKYRKNWSGV